MNADDNSLSYQDSKKNVVLLEFFIQRQLL
jgi:hypothetical protein